MIRRFSKYLLGGKQKWETYGEYYKRVSIVESKIKHLIGDTLALGFIIVTIMGMVILGLKYGTPKGAYVPDYVDEEGQYYDTNGDGMYFHWEDDI